jgi:uncharacterized membrane protein required for colicin V production
MQGYFAIGLSIVSVVVVLLMIKHGYTEKLFAASALFLRLAISFLLAMSFYKAITFLIVKSVHAQEYLTLRITFLILLWGAYVLLTELYERWMEPEHVILPTNIDRVGGMIFGALTGAVLVGLLFLTWSFIPFAQRIGPFPKDMPVDMGKVLIQEYANLRNRMESPGEFDRHKEIAAYHAFHEAEETPPAPAQSSPPAPAGPQKEGAAGAPSGPVPKSQSSPK